MFVNLSNGLFGLPFFWVLKFFGLRDDLLLYSRFKQIKEQEARRRQQREEKEKAGETVAKGTQLTNEGHEREARLLESENGAGSESVDENNPSNFGVVNGDLTGKDSEEDKIKSPVLRVEEDKVSANSKVGAIDEQQSYELVEKILKQECS